MEYDDVAERVKVTNHAYSALLEAVDHSWKDTPGTVDWPQYCRTVDELRDEWRRTVAEMQGLKPWW